MASLLVLGVMGQALTEPPPLVKVLISFVDQPGPAEQALVHSSGGRVYTIITTATDEAGNQDMAQTTVIVPHDKDS